MGMLDHLELMYVGPTPTWLTLRTYSFRYLLDSVCWLDPLEIASTTLYPLFMVLTDLLLSGGASIAGLGGGGDRSPRMFICLV